MAFFSWSRWFRSLLRPQVKPIRRRSRSLSFEQLENRLAPASFTWTGAANDGKWTTPGNWSGNMAPTGIASNLEDLTFQGSPQTANNTFVNATFNSITIASPSFILTGNSLTLGSTLTNGSGRITVNAGLLGEQIGFDIGLGGGGTTGQQVVTVNSNSVLTINGKISGSGIGLTKQGGGTMTLAADDSGFSGSFTIAAGVVQLNNDKGLGANNTTTVQQNAQLQLNNRGTVMENLKLNGAGVNNAGAILSTAGNNNLISGSVELDNDVTFGASAGTTLTFGTVGTFPNQITDLGAGHSVSKVGQGTVIFANSSNYRGTTAINDGVLEIENGASLGTNRVNVFNTITGQGTLELFGPASGPGMTIQNSQIFLQGSGFLDPVRGFLGALYNAQGFNTITGNVFIGDPNGPAPVIRTDGIDPPYSLTVTGKVADGGNTTLDLFKTGTGVLIFTNSNTYTGNTRILAGTLEIEDSQALGPKAKLNGAFVSSGATLELAIDNNIDSLTNNTLNLTVYTPVTISGPGVSGVGALLSHSGINTYFGTITFNGTAAIGVDPDPNPTNNAQYFTNDFSLTVPGTLKGGQGTVGAIPTNPTMQKVGNGQLILPQADTQFFGPVDIRGGWITVEDNQSLGGRIASVDQNLQPTVTVEAQAALHLLANPGQHIDLGQNFHITGQGIDHTFDELNHAGAIVNLAGINTIYGNIGFSVQPGIGVESVFGPSQLSLLGEQSQAASNSLTIPATALGSTAENDNIIDTGADAGTITVNYNMYYVPDSLNIYYGIAGQGGQLIGGTGGPVSGTGTITVNYGPSGGLDTTIVEIIMNQGGGTTGTFWTYTATIQTAGAAGNGFIKHGSGLLDIQGNGLYSGDVNIQQGVVLDQNNTGLGSAGNVNVAGGAALALANGTASENGGLVSGIQVQTKHLVINGDPTLQTVTVIGAQTGTFQLTFNGQTTTAIPDTATAAQVQSALAALSNIGAGNVTVTQSGNQYTVAFGGPLAGTIQPLMTASSSQGSTTVIVGTGLGNTTLGAPMAPFSALAGNTSPWAPGVTLFQTSPYLQQVVKPVGADVISPSDNLWGGPVTLNTSTPIDVAPGARLSLTGVIDDASNPAANGSDLIAVDTGELVLGGTNTYRGTTYIGTSATAGNPGFDPSGVNEFFRPASPQALSNAVLTITASQALGAPANGTVVQNGSSLQLEGNITVASEPLTVAGAGIPTAGSIESWFQQGPAPINNGQTLAAAAPVTGRVTSIAVDPNDPLTIYLTAGGGGAWKTVDGGRSWTPMFDGFSGNIFMGAVAIAPSNNNVLYLGTGEANNSNDSYAGVGVYMSTDAGHSWTLLTSSTGTPNPIAGMSVSKIAVDLTNSSRIYVATSNLGNPGSNLGGNQNLTAGIWRYDGTNWFNLTAVVSPNRQSNAPGTQSTPPQNPGPDDNYLLAFPQQTTTNASGGVTGVAWSDVAIVGQGNNAVLYAALGTPSGSYSHNYNNNPPIGIDSNAVYFTLNPASNQPVWYIGDGKTDGETSTTDFPQVGTAGNIKMSVIVPNPNAVTVPNPFFFATIDVYAAYADTNGGFAGEFLGTVGGGVLGLLGNQGMTYAAGKPITPPNGATQDVLDEYDLSIFTPDGTNVYIGTQTNLQWSSNSGGAFTDITKDSNGLAPHASFHVLSGEQAQIVPNAAGNNIFAGTDGGVWDLNAVAAANTWTDLNTPGLAIAQITGVGLNSNGKNASYVSTQASGIAQLTGNQTWQMSTDNGGASPYGARVVVDPSNPSVAYAYLTNSAIGNPGGAFLIQAILLKTTDGGTTWNTIINGPSFEQEPPLVIDNVDPQRLLIGADFPNFPVLVETLDAGNTFRSLAQFLPTFYSVNDIALASFQGPFVQDPFFVDSDQGSGSYVPSTIYVTDGQTIELTKNYGTSWVARNIPQLVGAYTISDIEVDPRNRDTIFATVSTFGNGVYDHVYRSTDAGRTWTDISNGLPDVPTWKLAIDPRTSSLYVGTDMGVFFLNGGVGLWSPLGSGLPQGQVKDLFLDTATNTLTAGSYGRSEFSILLNSTAANAGGLRVVSGSAIWTGPISLAGPTTFGAEGGPVYQRNGIGTATLNIVGSIGDLAGTNGQSNTLTKIGNGNIILSGQNTYAGLTDIKQGVLIANNPQALGANPSTAGNPGLGTLVESGTALQLENSVTGEPLTLNGDGPVGGFDGHNTGALESINNNNTYSGDITLATNATIGVDSGSTLTITGAITGAFNLTKELTGTLAFDPLTNPNTYSGFTYVSQGVLAIESSQALQGSQGTFVLDGAQLQLQSPDGVTPVIITGESLDLSGDGISGTGALLDTSGSNTWAGPVTLDFNPGFSPLTYPVGAGRNNPAGASIGVTNASDTLTISGPIGEALPSQLEKVGAGTLTLSGTNTFTGTTLVNSGVVTIQNAQALGNSTPTTKHEYQIDRVTMFRPAATGAVALTLFGQQTPNVDTTTSAATVQGYLQAILNTQFDAGTASVQVTKTTVTAPLPVGTPTPGFTEAILSILFQGPALVGLQPLVGAITTIVGITHNEQVVAIGGTGAQVSDGAALDIDLANSPNGQTVTGQPLSISGSGINGTGAVDNLSGVNTWNAGAQLNAASTIGVNGGSLSITGDVSGNPNAALTKVGTGTLFFPNANDYAGNTIIKAGILDIANPAALGLSNAVQTITISGNPGTFRVTFNGAQTGALSSTIPGAGGAGPTGSLQNALNALSSIGGVGGSVTVLRNGNLYTVTFGGSLAGKNLAQMTTTPSATTNADVATLVAGGPITNEVQSVTINGATTGSFTLTFNGQTTTSLVANDPNLVADMQQALNNLSTIGPNGVTVAQTRNIYSVTFSGPSLAGKPQPLMTSSVSSGTTADISEVTIGGLGITSVQTSNQSSGTLALRNNITVTQEKLDIAGPGQGGIGALMSSANSNTWGNATSTPILLDADASIGSSTDPSAASPSLTINQALIEANAGTNVTKVDAGTVVFAGTTPNTYTGTTFVNDGTLKLNKTGVLAIQGDLVVGDGTAGAPKTDVAILAQPGQMPASSNVTVNSDGLFDVNGQTQTIKSLTITDGTAQTGPSGKLTIGTGGLTMTGGTLNIGTGGQVAVNSNVNGTSSANSTATISGAGAFTLSGTSRTFTVADGPKAVDMDIQVPITGPGNVSVIKAGAGRLELDADSSATYTGGTTVLAGDLQVDGKIGDLVLNGGSVSGTGTTATTGNVGAITGLFGGVPLGTIDPGDNGSANPAGMLTTTPTTTGGTETWGKGTTFFVDLLDASTGAGVGNDLLVVNGSLNLGGNPAIAGSDNGGATLSGFVDPNVAVGDSFTIIQTTGGGTISGVFQQPFSANTVFIAGQKFTVDYSDPTKVVLTRQINNSSISVVSSANPSVYGQDFIFTATVTGEPGATAAFLPTDTVTFTLNLPGGGQIVDVESLGNNGHPNQAAFDANANGTLVPGSYTLDVHFSGDANYAPADLLGTPQTIKQAATTTTLSPSPSNPVYGQTLTINATIAPKSPGAGIPTGQITFSVDNGPGQTITFDSSAGGHVSLPVSGLGVGQHSFAASYSGDTNFTGSNASTLFVTVNKDTSSIQLASSPASPGVLGQPVTFTATVTTDGPGTAVPSGNVTFFDGNQTIGSGTLTLVSGNYVASVTTSTLTLGTHTIKATYPGNAQETGNSTTISFQVIKVGTTTALVSSTGPNPSVFGQSVTFTATVTANTGSATPVGSVTFTDGNTTLGTQTLDAQGVAKLTTANLSAGIHNITATYNGNTTFASSSGSLSQQVQFSSATAVTGNPNPANFGQSVAFTAKVTPGVGMPAGTPTGTVDIFVDGSDSGPLNLVGGSASETINSLSAGAHTVTAQYNGSVTYGVSTSNTLTENVVAATAISLARQAGDPNPSLFSQPVTFIATLTETPNTVTPTGTVTFFVDGKAQTPNITASGNTASFTFTTIPLGSHNITAKYNGDANTSVSPLSNAVSQQVNADTTSTNLTSSANPSDLGSPVSFTATVLPTGGGTGTPTGNVSFFIDGAYQATVNLSAGTASFTINGLAFGSHAVSASYSGDGNFLTSSNAFTQKVLNGTKTALVITPSPTTFNGATNLTATVSYMTGTGQLTGTVAFVDTTTNTPLGSATVNGATGQATLSTSFNTVGTHHITATYSGDSTFNTSTTAQDVSVLSGANVSLQHTGGNNPSVFTEPVSFLATVAPTAPGSPMPTGTVDLLDGSNVVASMNLQSGQNQVTFTIGTLLPGSHNLMARYDGDANIAGGTSGNVTQSVIPDATNTAIAADLNPAVFGQTVTFTATVTPTGAATGTPTGSVTFFIDNSNVGTVNLNGNQATFMTNTLSVTGSPHTVHAVYNGSQDGGFTGSQAVLAGGEQITIDSSKTDVTSTANPSGVGQAVTFIATVSGAHGGTPTGTVDFMVDGGNANAANGGFEQVIGLANGQANYTVTALAKGSHSVQVVYGGDANYTGSQGMMTQNVNYATFTNVISTLNPSSAGQQVTFDATVAYFQGVGVVTGNVIFYDVFNGQTTTLGTKAVSNGHATLTTSFSSSGTHLIVASYQGDSNFAFSSNVVYQTVGVPPSAIFGTDSSTDGISFTFYGYALSASGFIVDYNAPAMLEITSGPGTFTTGLSTAGGSFSGGTSFFFGIKFTAAGTYHLKIVSGNLASEDIVVGAGRAP